jgi:hypothetical protein
MRRSITPNGEEVRQTDTVTGGEKGSKLQRYELIPVAPLEEVAKLYGTGAAKYAERNWERGYSWSLSYASLQRHSAAFWDGESLDEETGRHHLASVIFHAMALMEFELKGAGTDDRPVDQMVERESAFNAKLRAGWAEMVQAQYTDDPVETRRIPHVWLGPEGPLEERDPGARYSDRNERALRLAAEPTESLWDDAEERTERAFESAAEELYPDSPISWLDRDNPLSWKALDD